jgi:hypothetical protein
MIEWKTFLSFCISEKNDIPFFINEEGYIIFIIRRRRERY